MLLGLAVILTFISFALINNTIRLAIYSKRFLIHTMKLVGVLRTGVGQGDYARGDGAGVGCRAGVRCTYYVAVRFAFHQQISEDEGKHTVLYLTP